MTKTPNEAIDILLDQAIGRAEAQLARHRSSLVRLQEQKRDTKTMQAQIDFYEEQIVELQKRKTAVLYPEE